MPRPKLTPRQRSELARLANAERWSRLTAEQRRAQTEPARRARMQKYLDQCPLDPEIADPEQREQDRMTRALKLRDADLIRARRKAEDNRREREARLRGAGAA